MIIAGGGVYLVLRQKEQISSTPKTNSQRLSIDSGVTIIAPTTAKVSPIAQISSTIVLGPKETFIKFRTEFDSTKTFDEALAVSIQYATQDRAIFFRNQSTQVTEEMKVQLFPGLKSMIPTINSVSIVSENTIGNISTLTLKNNNDVNTTGTVTLKKESGVWKIEGEAWR